MRESVSSRNAGMHITHTYGFPIVSHCRERARPREIPVTIGDRTMDPSEIAGKSPLRPGPADPRQTLFMRGRTVRGMKRQSTMCETNGGGCAGGAKRRTMIFRYIRTDVRKSHRYDVGQSSADAASTTALKYRQPAYPDD